MIFITNHDKNNCETICNDQSQIRSLSCLAPLAVWVVMYQHCNHRKVVHFVNHFEQVVFRRLVRPKCSHHRHVDSLHDQHRYDDDRASQRTACDQKRNQKTSSGQQHGRVQSRLAAVFESAEQFFQRHVVVGVLELSVKEPVHERDCDYRQAYAWCSKRSSQRHNTSSACGFPRLELWERRQQQELVRLEHQSEINRERKRLIHFAEQASSLRSIACFAFEFAVAQTESQVHGSNQRDNSDQRKVVDKSAAWQQSEVFQIVVLEYEVQPVGNCFDAGDVFERHKVEGSCGRLEAGQVVYDWLRNVWISEQQQQDQLELVHRDPYALWGRQIAHREHECCANCSADYWLNHNKIILRYWFTCDFYCCWVWWCIICFICIDYISYIIICCCIHFNLKSTFSNNSRTRIIRFSCRSVLYISVEYLYIYRIYL